MEWLSSFWKSAPGALRTVVVALALITLSQFIDYGVNNTHSVFSHDSDWSTEVTTVVDREQAGSGWHLHPFAVPALAILWIAFLVKDIRESPQFRKWGWWAALVVAVFAVNPLDVQAAGGLVGLWSFVALIVAAVLHWRAERKLAKAGKSPPPA